MSAEFIRWSDQWPIEQRDACEDKALADVVDTDPFWQVPLSAFQAGYRHATLGLYRNPQLLADLVKAQAFQSGRRPDELTRRLEASWRIRVPQVRQLAWIKAIPTARESGRISGSGNRAPRGEKNF